MKDLVRKSSGERHEERIAAGSLYIAERSNIPPVLLPLLAIVIE